MLTIRPARATDSALLLAFVRELAEYEKQPQDVVATETDFLRDGFGPRPRFEAVIAEWDGQPAGFALWFYNSSTWTGRHGLYFEDLFVRPAHAAGASARRCSPTSPGSPSRNSSELTERDVLAFFNDKFLIDQILTEYVGGLKERGLFVVNTTQDKKRLLASFPKSVQANIRERQIKLVTLDATQAALKYLNRNLPGAAIVGLINKETGILSEEEFRPAF